jgi:CO/xanthine dehydrogenase Mo-binding subunit
MTTTPDSTPAARHSPPTTHDSFRVVGHNVERVDGLEKVTGAAQYVADIRLPGMLEGRILRSPYPHARVVRVDTSRAAALPGVLAVVTGEDTPKRRWGAFQRPWTRRATWATRWQPWRRSTRPRPTRR